MDTIPAPSSGADSLLTVISMVAASLTPPPTVRVLYAAYPKANPFSEVTVILPEISPSMSRFPGSEASGAAVNRSRSVMLSSPAPTPMPVVLLVMVVSAL